MRLTKTELQNWHKYHVPSQSHRTTRPRNAVFIHESNSILHELTKFIVALQIQRNGDAFVNENINDLIRDLNFQLTMIPESKDKHYFITEAVPNDRPKRRIDVVDIANSNEFEVETNPKIKKENCIPIYI